MQRTYDLNPLYYGLAVLVGIGSLGLAWGVEYIGEHVPCYLCLWERLPYGLSLLVGFFGLVWPRRVGYGGYLVLCFVFLASTLLSSYHVGVEQHLVSPSESCTGHETKALQAQTVEELEAALSKIPVARCDEVSLRFFGLSLAELNMGISMILCGIYAYAFLRKKERGNVV